MSVSVYPYFHLFFTFCRILQICYFSIYIYIYGFIYIYIYIYIYICVCGVCVCVCVCVFYTVCVYVCVSGGSMYLYIEKTRTRTLMSILILYLQTVSRCFTSLSIHSWNLPPIIKNVNISTRVFLSKSRTDITKTIKGRFQCVYRDSDQVESLKSLKNSLTVFETPGSYVFLDVFWCNLIFSFYS